MSKELISTNPAKGYEEVGRINISTPEEIKDAVLKAKKALPKWRELSAKDRGDYFLKFFMELITTKKFQ